MAGVGVELQLISRYFGQLGPHLAPVTMQAARHLTQALSARTAASKRQPATKPLSDGMLLEEYFAKHASSAKGGEK